MCKLNDSSESGELDMKRKRQAAMEHGLTGIIVAVEVTDIDHKRIQRAFCKAGFDTRIVHPFASKHFQKPLLPDNRTDDNDFDAISR